MNEIEITNNMNLKDSNVYKTNKVNWYDPIRVEYFLSTKFYKHEIPSGLKQLI